jgi:2,3-bisphosphoglycerate-independent phosphoglycerate mutase
MTPRGKKVVLLILDGWGWRVETVANAVRMARTPNVDALWTRYPHTLIEASGPWVGLPEGQMGNSEVGHLNIGAGRIVYQDIVRIDRAIADGSFFAIAAFAESMDRLRGGGSLHLAGLLSDGGVHSHEKHLYALLEMAKRHGLQKVFVHAILDGRDTSPHGGVEYLIGTSAGTVPASRTICSRRARGSELRTPSKQSSGRTITALRTNSSNRSSSRRETATPPG